MSSAADSLGFETLAQGLLSTDNETRSVAEHKYSDALRDDPASVIFALLNCLHHGQVRMLRIKTCTLHGTESAASQSICPCRQFRVFAIKTNDKLAEGQVMSINHIISSCS